MRLIINFIKGVNILEKKGGSVGLFVCLSGREREREDWWGEGKDKQWQKQQIILIVNIVLKVVTSARGKTILLGR